MWTPDYLTRKLNEAQYRFCEDTGLFVDRATYAVNVAAGTKITRSTLRLFVC